MIRTGATFFPAGLAVALVFTAASAYAQGYPTKPVRFIVPFAPGGGTDTLTRILAQKLTETMGQPVIVDNRPGAGGTIGTDIVAKASPDGYTLAMVISSHAINPSLYSKLPYDTTRDFAPVILVDVSPRIMVVHPSIAAATLKDFIAAAKAKPGQINYASGGNGTSGHLAGELFKSMAGVNLVHVPYKGGGPLLLDLIAGQVQMTFGSPPTTLPQIKAGKLRALALTSAKRSPMAPELPTMQEAGLLGYQAGEWNGVLAPAATPKHLVNRLNEEISKTLALPEVRANLLKQGIEPVGGTPEQFAAHLRAEIAKFARVVKDAGIRIE